MTHQYNCSQGKCEASCSDSSGTYHDEGSCRCCSCCGCGCNQQKSKCEDFGYHLLELADQAWMDVLKEKIKENIRSSGDKQLDELAKIISETNRDRWQHKIAKKKACTAYKDKLAAFFGRK